MSKFCIQEISPLLKKQSVCSRPGFFVIETSHNFEGLDDYLYLKIKIDTKSYKIPEGISKLKSSLSTSKDQTQQYPHHFRSLLYVAEAGTISTSDESAFRVFVRSQKREEREGEEIERERVTETIAMLAISCYPNR